MSVDTSQRCKWCGFFSHCVRYATKKICVLDAICRSQTTLPFLGCIPILKLHQVWITHACEPFNLTRFLHNLYIYMQGISHDRVPSPEKCDQGWLNYDDHVLWLCMLWQSHCVVPLIWYILIHRKGSREFLRYFNQWLT